MSWKYKQNKCRLPNNTINICQNNSHILNENFHNVMQFGDCEANRTKVWPSVKFLNENVFFFPHI